MDKIKEKISMAIGQASVCWSEIPKGVFDSEQAELIAEQLYLVFLQEFNKRPAPIDLGGFKDILVDNNLEEPKKVTISFEDLKAAFEAERLGGSWLYHVATKLGLK